MKIIRKQRPGPAVVLLVALFVAGLCFSAGYFATQFLSEEPASSTEDGDGDEDEGSEGDGALWLGRGGWA